MKKKKKSKEVKCIYCKRVKTVEIGDMYLCKNNHPPIVYQVNK